MWSQDNFGVGGTISRVGGGRYPAWVGKISRVGWDDILGYLTPREKLSRGDALLHRLMCCNNNHHNNYYNNYFI